MSKAKFNKNPCKCRSSRSAVEASADWLRLPNELWCSVFSYLPLIDLFSAEQVSQRWKDLVDLQLRSRRQLTVDYSTCNVNNIVIYDVRRILERYGQNLEELTVIDAKKLGFNSAVEMIGDWCPNLVKLAIEGETSISGVALHKVAVKCVQLQSLSLLGSPSFSYSGLKYALMKLKHLKQLKIDRFQSPWFPRAWCIAHLTPNIEELSLHGIHHLRWSFLFKLPEKYKNLYKLDLSTTMNVNRIFLYYFSQKYVNIKDLSLRCQINSELLNKICQMHWLEKLHIKSSSGIDDRCLRLIADGCPNLRAFSLVGSHITDEGVKYLIEHCPQLVELDLSRNQKLTDVA